MFVSTKEKKVLYMPKKKNLCRKKQKEYKQTSCALQKGTHEGIATVTYTLISFFILMQKDKLPHEIQTLLNNVRVFFRETFFTWRFRSTYQPY